MAQMAMPYNANYGNPYSYGNTINGVPSTNANQNQLMYGNQLPQQNFGSFMTVLVQGEAGANAYPVASGNTVMLMDYDSGKFWIKSNVNGIPQRLRSFSFREDVQDQQQVQQSAGQPISRVEFDNLAQNVSSLSNDVKKLIEELGGTNE